MMVLLRRILCQTVAFLAVLLFLLAPGSGRAADLSVVASILPLGDFCRHIGGEQVEVQVLIPPGASPHVFEPSPAAVAKAMESRVWVYVGAGLDPWAERLVRSRGSRGFLAVKAVQGIPLITETAPHHHDHEKPRASGPPRPAAQEGKTEDSPAEKHTHQQGNPHVWLDPVLAQDICRRIAQAFIQADPEHQQQYESNLSAYLEQLAELHQEITQKVATFRHRDYVTFHPAFTYFSRRYGLREVGVIEVAPGREPSPRHLQRIIAAVKKSGVNAIFAEPQLSPRVAKVIAQEAGVKVLFLDPLGGRPPYGNDYLKLMRHNLKVLAQALQ
jgi:zinc transport system substrate-binding protein